LLLHGHFGIEIIFITQRPAKLNADVLASVTSHFIMRRKFGMDAAMIWEFGEAMTTWSKSTATYALNKTLWRYPKHLYKFYVSSENHQVRKSFPLKYIAFAFVPLFLFGYGFTKAKETGFMGLFQNEKNIQEHPQQYSTQNQQKQEQPQTLICNESNIESEQCKELAKTKNSQINPGTNLTNTVYYVPSDPYATQIQAVQELNDVDFPRLSGCVKYGGKYYGIDQQGNRMPTVKQETCKRWFNGERPFDYFKQQDQTQYQPQLTQIQPQQTEKLKQQDPEQ
jgi:zona occludens toxin